MIPLTTTSAVTGGTFKAAGPQVSFDLTDKGQADVLVAVVLSDGTKLVFPDGGGKTTHGSTTLPPGKYACTTLVYANAHGAFGTTYDSGVSINGTPVVSASGSLPSGGSDMGNTSFVLVV